MSLFPFFILKSQARASFPTARVHRLDLEKGGALGRGFRNSRVGAHAHAKHIIRFYSAVY